MANGDLVLVHTTSLEEKTNCSPVSFDVHAARDFICQLPLTLLRCDMLMTRLFLRRVSTWKFTLASCIVLLAASSQVFAIAFIEDPQKSAQSKGQGNQPPSLSSLPNNLNVIPTQQGIRSSALSLRDVKYSGTAALGRPVAGTADIALTLVGHPLPLLKSQKFTGIVHDRLGRNSGVRITLSDDLIARRFLGNKFDLVLEKGGEIAEDIVQRGGSSSFKFKGSVRIHLPYVTENGKAVEVHLGTDRGRKAIEIPLSSAGFTLADQGIPIQPTTLMVDGFKFLNIRTLGSIRLQVNPQQTKPCSLETTLGPTEVIGYLPRFLLITGFHAYTQQVKLEDSVQQQGGSIPDVGVSTFTAATKGPTNLQFIRPAGFSMNAKAISFKVVKGDYTDALVEGKLQLPDIYTEYKLEPKPQDDGKTKQVDKEGSEKVVPGSGPITSSIEAKLIYSTAKGPHPFWSSAGSGAFTATWNEGRFGLIVENGTMYSLLLDGPGGIKVSGGKFFARAFKGTDNRPIEIALKTGDEFFLQSVGASGQIAMNPKELNPGLVCPGAPKYKITITSPTTTWRFTQGHLTGTQNCFATIDVPSKADLSAKIAINQDGIPTVSLAGGHLSLPGYGLYFAIAQGTIKPPDHYPPPKDGKQVVPDPLFHLSGTITFDIPTLPQLKSVAVPVTDIIFNADGLFGDPFDKNSRTKIPIGQVDVDLKSFVLIIHDFDLPNTYQYDSKKQRDPHLSLNGEAHLSDDFPNQKYDPGLRVSPTKSTVQLDDNPAMRFVSINTESPEISATSFGFLSSSADAPAVPNFEPIHVVQNFAFGRLDFTISKEKRLFGGENVDCMFGKGSLYLGDGPGGELTMFVAKGAWLVFGSIEPPVPIPLGNSSLKIYAFRGGLGNNINVKANVLTSGKTGGDLTPDDFLSAPGNFLFQAGVGISTTDDFLAWGNAMLTFTTSPVTMTIAVAANIFEARAMGKKPSGDRQAVGSLSITTKSVTAQLAADLNFPTRSFRLVSISGTSEFYIGSGDQHLYLGWPLPDKAAGISLLGGVLTLKGGMGLDVKQTPNKSNPNQTDYDFRLGAGFIWRESFLGIVTGQLDGSLFASLEKHPQNTNLTLGGEIHLFGEVDFYVFSASAEAWLGGSLATSPFQLHVYGGIQGCIGTPLGDTCASVDFDGTWP